MFNLLNYRNPFAELARMQRNLASTAGFFDREFGRFGGTDYPAVNMYEGDDDLVLTAQVPGVSVEDLEVSAVNDVLTIKGERHVDDNEKKEGENGARRYHRREIAYGDFVRSLRLPERFDLQAAEAELKDGVLVVAVPKRPESKPKRLTVKS